MQVRFATGLTSEEYVSQEAWRSARLERCPFHPEGGCGFTGHGSYPRVSPPGCRIARNRCPTARVTIGLIPEFLCSRLTGTLEELEATVATVEAAPTREAASEVLRPEVELPGALRWLRCRTRLVHAGLTAVIGLLPELLAGCKPTVASFRSALGTEAVLVLLREKAAPHLGSLPPPLGFGPRPAKRGASSTALPHKAGPDPPQDTR